MKLRWLLVLVPLLAGCEGASVTEWFGEKPQAPVEGEPVPPPTRTVSRKVEASKFAGGWWSPSPGETIAQVQPAEIPAKGGARFGGMKPFDLRRVGPTILIWAGIGIAVLGVALIVFLPGARLAGIYTAAGGGALVVAGIAFEAYPWIALLIVSAAVLGGLVWFVWGTAAGARIRAAFATVVKGVENAGPEAAPVKAKIKEAANVAGNRAIVDKAVAATVAKAKGA